MRQTVQALLLGRGVKRWSTENVGQERHALVKMGNGTAYLNTTDGTITVKRKK